MLESDEAYIWAMGGINDDGADTPFLVKNGIKGYLLANKITSPMKEINSRVSLIFTGRVFKKWPNWAEYHIGGSRKNIAIEVTVEGNNYLIFGTDIPIYLSQKLPKRCKFTDG